MATAFSLVHGQDSRNVTEPRIPATCAVVQAGLAAPGGLIAEADEARLDTQRIQAAMDDCKGGGAVLLKADGARNIFLSGPLELRSKVWLVVQAGVALVASRDPRVYDLAPGSCGVVNEKGHGCRPLIHGENLADAGVAGEGVIEGRGGATLLGEAPGAKTSWWDLAHQAKIEDKQQSVPWLIVVNGARNFTLYGITLRNSPGFHVAVNQADGFTAWGVKIDTPKTARNTDGIDPGSSRNVTIAHCWIHAGDDDVAIKAGKAGATANVSILDNHFFTGHGMSIGSETNGGVSHVLVRDLSIDGADNGIRIKSDRSRGGLVQDVTYENVCIRNTKDPLVFTPAYTKKSGDLLPVYRGITLRDVHIESPGQYTFDGLDDAHPLELRFDNVWADGLAQSKFEMQAAKIVRGPRLGNLTLSGADGTTSDDANSVAGTPPRCTERYAEFPHTNAPEIAGVSAPEEDHAIYVAADGTGEYTRVEQAVEVAPDTGATILIAPGVYREIVTVTKPHVTLRGTGADPAAVVIVNDHNAGENGGTLHSATVNVRADDFTAENLTMENDFNRTHQQVSQGSQALALLVTGDRAIFRRVHLLGNQDTVYAGSRNCSPDGPACVPSRQYFSDCVIAGNVDFIFGDGKAVFEGCEIRSTAHKGGFLTAQAKHYPDEDSGFVLDHCKLTADAGAEAPIYLGRPWRPYATVVYLHTWMGAHIAPDGWREWKPGETHSLDTAYYAEYDSSGPGARMKEREPQAHALTAAEAARWEPQAFLHGSDGWNPVGAKDQR
ncbi:pectinesterase family protein [Silvibacterium sp.]|uniref:pectinesterase family protein n=1 Tax=Silvibacterium sp. TaxID=1964179 RepID=UPI0039E2BB10